MISNFSFYGFRGLPTCHIGSTSAHMGKAYVGAYVGLAQADVGAYVADALQHRPRHGLEHNPMSGPMCARAAPHGTRWLRLSRCRVLCAPALRTWDPMSAHRADMGRHRPT